VPQQFEDDPDLLLDEAVNRTHPQFGGCHNLLLDEAENHTHLLEYPFQRHF
jgi:hypothetical protein